MNKLVTELALYDIVGVAGVAADISHCNTPVKVRERHWCISHKLHTLARSSAFTVYSTLRCLQVSAYTGAEELAGALKGADLVVIPAGVPRKPGMTRDDLFNTNAGTWHW